MIKKAPSRNLETWIEDGFDHLWFLGDALIFLFVLCILVMLVLITPFLIVGNCIKYSSEKLTEWISPEDDHVFAPKEKDGYEDARFADENGPLVDDSCDCNSCKTHDPENHGSE